MGRVTLYVHPLCSSSYRVLKELWRVFSGAGGAEIVVVDRVPGLVLRKLVVSVPWLEVDGVAVATDPLDPQLVVAALRGEDLRRFAPTSPRDAVELLGRGVVASSYASILSLIHQGLEPVLDLRDFVAAASRARLAGFEEEVLKLVAEAREELYRELRGLVLRAVAKNFVREVAWVSENPEDALRRVSVEQVALWMVAKVSLGRSLVPLNLNRVLGVAREVIEVLRERGRRYLESVAEELRVLTQDTEYASILSELGHELPRTVPSYTA